jgi:N-acetylneuraminate synthase
VSCVIAEIGVNHNGSLALALEMIDAASEVGADAVKFQTFHAESLVTVSAPKAAYQSETTGAGSQLEMLRKLELDLASHHALQARAHARGVEFLSAPFDLRSVALLGEIGVSRIKIPSGHLTNVPYLRAVAALGLPVILSTGMATLEEVAASIEVLERAGVAREDLVVLHCTTEYPTPIDDVNLLAMVTMREALRVRVGYSDHTEGIAVPIAAVALGAEVIEKHFTLSRSMPGPDHRASIEPDEFGRMVRSIRDVETSLGDGLKRPAHREMANIGAARTSIVAAREVLAGETLTEDALAVKRPGTGTSPLRWDDVVGTTARRAYRADELIDEPEANDA